MQNKSAIKVVRGVELGVAGVGMKLSFQQWLRIACTCVQPEHCLDYPLSAQPRYELDRAVTQTEKSNRFA